MLYKGDVYLIIINIKEREVKYPINIRAGTPKRCHNYNGIYIAFNINYYY